MTQAAKYQGGLITAVFDFSIQSLDTPASAVVLAYPYQGTDTTPLVMGTLTITGPVVYQEITAGTPGMIYQLWCNATYSGGEVRQMEIPLAVLPGPLTGPITSYTIGGTISGLTGSAAVLQDNGGDDLSISVDGPFTFATPVALGDTYNVSVLTNPPSLLCIVSSGSGTVAGNVTDVVVTCLPF